MNEAMEAFEKWYRQSFRIRGQNMKKRKDGSYHAADVNYKYDTFKAGRESMKTPPGEPQDWESILAEKEKAIAELEKYVIRCPACGCLVDHENGRADNYCGRECALK